MNTNDIVVQLDAEILRLQQAKALLSDTDATYKRKRGRPVSTTSSNKTHSFDPEKFAGKSKVVRTLSSEARAKIAAAQKARWSKSKKAAKKAARNTAETPAGKKSRAKSVSPKTTPVKKAVSAKKAVNPKTETHANPAA
jgi:hypothetical protein